MIDSPELMRCFSGVIPSLLATASKDGVPNVTYLSQVHYIDAKHVALSRQFFNKTYQNVLENPYASVELHDPVNYDCYRLGLRFERSETEGPLFEQMSARIDAIATLTGMAGVFKLIAADIYEVISFEHEPTFLQPESESEACPVDSISGGAINELRGVQVLSERINGAQNLESLLSTTLRTLHQLFNFAHSMVLLVDESGEKLYTIATHGYDERGVGAEVPIGVGVIGTVAKEKKPLSIVISSEMRYGRAVRQRFEESRRALGPEIALPGLPDAASELVLPLTVQDRLIGVLAIESVNPCAFHMWHETFLTIIANQIAMAMDRFMRIDDDAPDEEPVSEPSTSCARARRTFHFYTNDDCIFVDGEYLIRNVPAKILWKLLRAHHEEGRCQFSNRELRLDESLGLPAIKDNLESRLILLKKRLAEKVPEVRLQATARGRFALELDAEIELVERASA